jgi:hypothetical protein
MNVPKLVQDLINYYYDRDYFKRKFRELNQEFYRKVKIRVGWGDDMDRIFWKESNCQILSLKSYSMIRSYNIYNFINNKEVSSIPRYHMFSNRTHHYYEDVINYEHRSKSRASYLNADHLF